MERVAEQPEADDARAAPAQGEEEAPDYSTEGIRRHIQQRWDHRPAGIRYARWEAMLEDFSGRMAARIAAEHQMAEEGAAHCVMRLSRGLDTIEAVQFCGLTISNLASDQAAHKILVEAGAISTLMEWLAKQTAPL